MAELTAEQIAQLQIDLKAANDSLAAEKQAHSDTVASAEETVKQLTAQLSAANLKAARSKSKEVVEVDGTNYEIQNPSYALRIKKGSGKDAVTERVVMTAKQIASDKALCKQLIADKSPVLKAI